MPKFSVIVPVYNVEGYVKKCIDSILKQTFDDYEIVAVDDGSTDDSGQLLKELARNNDKIKVIHQENKGLGGARNTGIDASTGEYLLFIDSDDYIENNTLSEIYKTIEKHNAKMVMFDYKMVSEDGKVLENVSACNTDKDVFSIDDRPETIFDTNSAVNKAYHRSLFVDTGVRFPEREWYEDLSTIVKLYPFTEKIAYIKESFYNYVQRSGSIMSNKKIERNGEIISAVNSLFNFYKEKNLYEKYKDELQYLAVLHIYVLATVRVIKADSKSHLLNDFRDFVNKNIADFHNNKYVLKMSKKEKLIIKLVDSKNYFALKAMLKLNDTLKK